VTAGPGPAVPPEAALLVIDVQKGFDDPVWGRRNNPEAETNIARLVEAWRRTGRRVLWVRHRSRLPYSPLRPGQPGNGFKEVVGPQPGEPVIDKEVNSAFIGTDLEERLRAHGHATVVLTGVQTNHCVETTARMAGNLGFETYVVSDATWTFDRTGPDGVLYPAEQIQSVSLASLHGEFATVVPTDGMLAAVGEERAADPEPAGRVEAIFVTPEGSAPMERRAEVRAVPGRGLEGDRYFTGTGTWWRADRTGQELTLVEAEAIERLRDAGMPMDLGGTRRNVVTRGISLDALLGRRFRLGDVELVAVRPCDPCGHMEKLSGVGGVRAGLEGRGGIRAEVLTEGTIREGDTVRATG
jgi:nicotinamidase-related amidase